MTQSSRIGTCCDLELNILGWHFCTNKTSSKPEKNKMWMYKKICYILYLPPPPRTHFLCGLTFHFCAAVENFSSTMFWPSLDVVSLLFDSFFLMYIVFIGVIFIFDACWVCLVGTRQIPKQQPPAEQESNTRTHAWHERMSSYSSLFFVELLKRKSKGWVVLTMVTWYAHVVGSSSIEEFHCFVLWNAIWRDWFIGKVHQ